MGNSVIKKKKTKPKQTAVSDFTKLIFSEADRPHQQKNDQISTTQIKVGRIKGEFILNRSVPLSRDLIDEKEPA